METYEQCRDPPPLHLLDRFDVGGPGSCLRKYSDPTFFRKELSNSSKADDVKVQRDQAHRKRKKKKLPQRNICRSRAVSTSDETNGARLSSLTDDRQTTSQSTSTVDMPRSSNMQDLSDIIDQSHLQGQSDSQEKSEAQVQSDFQESSKPRDSITGSGYIEYVINQSPVNKPDVKLIEGFLSSLQTADRISSPDPKGCVEVVDDNILYSPSEDIPVPCATIVCDEKKETLESRVEKSNKDEEASEIHESKFGPGTPDRMRQNQRDFDRTYIFFDEVDIVGEKQSKSQANSIDGKSGIENEGEIKSEQGSEADEFVDARNTIESESESELDGVPKPKLEHYFGDISTYCSEDANSDSNDGSEDTPYEQTAEDLEDESCSGSYLPEDADVSCYLSDPVCGKTMSPDETFQKPRKFFSMCPSLLAEKAFPDVALMREEPVATNTLTEGNCANEKISSDPSLKEAIPSEKISPEKHVACCPSLAEAVPHEKILPGESVANYPSFAEIFPHEKILPEISLPKIHSAGKVFPDNMTPADATHPSFPKADQEKTISPEVPDSKILAVPEAVSPEQISLDTYPCLAEAAADERFLTEEPVTTCLPLTEAMPVEKLLPEKPLEVNYCLAESHKDSILQEKYDGSTHSTNAKAAPEENLSSEVLDSTNLSVAEAVSREKTRLEEFVGIDPCLTEAVPDESVLSGEPVTTCLSLTKAVATEEALPEEFLEIYPSLTELPDEKISLEETDDATNLSEVSDVKISPEVFGYTDLSQEDALPQEQISLEECVGINPCLAEAVPDERFLLEEPEHERLLSEEPITRCISLTKAATIEGLLPEKSLETYPSFGELPEEKILHEEADDATHPSLSEAVSYEQISSEVLDSTNLLEAEAIPQEQIGLEEFVGLDPCLTEAVPDERILPEEPVTTCKAVAIEEVLPPEEPMEAYASLEKLPNNTISLEKSDDATHPSLSEAVSYEQFSSEVLESTNSLEAEAIPQEQIALEEFVGIDPCLAEALPDERILPKEPVTTCISLAKGVAMEEVLPPEEPLEAYASLEESPNNKISQEKSDDATHPSCAKAESDENVSPKVLDPKNLSVAEAIPQEQIALEEFVGIDPCLAEAAPYKRVLPEEAVTTCLSLTKAAPIEEILPGEPLKVYHSLEELPEEKISEEEEPNDATNPYISEAVGDEKISPLAGPGSTYPSLEESVPHEKTSYMSLAEALPDEKISLEEPDATCRPSPEAVMNENISGSEAPGYTTEAAPHNKTFPEEPVATYLSLNEAIFDEKIPRLEDPGSTTETGPHNKTFPEEPVATYLPLSEPVPEENIRPKEPAAAYLDLAEGIPDQKVFLDDAAFLSFAEAIFDQKFSPEVPDSTYPSFTEREMPIAQPPLVTDLPAKKILVKEAEAYDEPSTASDVSVNQKSGFLEPESADRTVILSGGNVTNSPDTQESLSNDTIVESVSIWSNGGLLGLAPSKPPVFSEPNSVSEHIQNEINEASVPAARKQESSSRSVEATEKSSLSLVVSDPTSQQQSNMLTHSNGSHSHLQSTATSFKVFGLSHRLLMAGFRGNSSSTCKFDSIPTTSYDTKVAAIADKTQQTLRGSSFEEQLDYDSYLFGSPTSSPPVQHMKISFNPINPSPDSKLKLRIPCQPQCNGGNADMFPSFQLVPEASNSDDEDNSDIFCQSSPCVSDNCLSDSELWESDESPRGSASSLKEAGERSTHGDMGSFSGSFLDLPCFDSVEHQSTSPRLEQEQDQDLQYKPSVSEIIRDWPPNQPKDSPSNEANANAVLKKTQNQSVGL
ncbi:scar-like domain-containing protein WAVE 5 isoform X2 [Eutrema salsugineum]|nr:scar-like domain-containing protein WAVE 5 isoform X2 [Eutrema salsugineum]